MMSERLATVAIARSWLGTPYHHRGQVKGAGVDCLTLLYKVYEEAGMIPPRTIPNYAKDWHLHRGTELYLGGLSEYANEVEDPPLPADILLWRFGRCFSHGAIVVDYPTIIHAYIMTAVSYENAEQASYLKTIGEPVADQGKIRPVKLFRLKRWIGG